MIRILPLLLIAGCGGDCTSGTVNHGALDVGTVAEYRPCSGIVIREALRSDPEYHVAVIRHEIGHMLGLGHVGDFRCVMYHDAGIVSDQACQGVPDKAIELRPSDLDRSATIEAAAFWIERGASIVVK